MRKIKLEVKCRVPSWNFCNLDGFTANGRFSKELCRFCVKDKTGYRCVLHDTALAADPDFVHKAPDCIKATAGYAISPDEPQASPMIDPKLLIRDTLKNYKKTVDTLIAQGYPRSMAEQAAWADATGGTK